MTVALAPNTRSSEPVTVLEQALRPLGIEPTLEIREIDDGAFRANPSESNRIWIAGRPLEEWLEGDTGKQPVLLRVRGC